MKRMVVIFTVLSWILIVLPSCKTEFEKVRVSGSPEQYLSKGIEYFDGGDYLRAQTLLELAIPSYRGKREAEELFFKYAYTHYYLGKYILAAYYFKNFASNYPNSPFREEADYMAAFSNYQLSPGYRLDQTYTQEAIKEFQTFANNYPNSERLTRANLLIDEMRRKLEKKAFAAAELYYNLKQYQAAIQSFENLLKDFPETPDAENVRYLIVRSYFQWADNSIREKQPERFRQTLDAYERFAKKYPNSQFNKELDTIVKKTQEQLKILEDV